MDPHTGLNDLDYTVLGIIALSGVFALMRGFVREVLSLGAWAGAYFAAAKLYPYFEPNVHHYIKNPTVVTAVSALGIFIFVLVVLTLLGTLISGFVKGTKLTSVDRSLGFLFGLMRGALVVSLVYLGAVTILWPDIDKLEAVSKDQENDRTKVAKPLPPEWLMEARTRPAMAYGAHELRVFIPQSQIEKTTQKYQDQKAAAQHLLDQQKLDMLSTPVTSSGKAPEGTSSYDNSSRDILNQLVNQKGAP